MLFEIVFVPNLCNILRSSLTFIFRIVITFILYGRRIVKTFICISDFREAYFVLVDMLRGVPSWERSIDVKYANPATLERGATSARLWGLRTLHFSACPYYKLSSPGHQKEIHQRIQHHEWFLRLWISYVHHSHRHPLEPLPLSLHRLPEAIFKRVWHLGHISFLPRRR